MRLARFETVRSAALVAGNCGLSVSEGIPALEAVRNRAAMGMSTTPITEAAEAADKRTYEVAGRSHGDLSTGEDGTNLPPLLVTSAVVVTARYTVLRDAQQRRDLTLHALGQWLRRFPRLQVVLCDGSGFDFSPFVKERFPGSAVECLSFRNSGSSVARYGKGFGEGEIVKYALDHSAYLAAAESFSKCTSKLWVPDYEALVKEWNGEFLCAALFQKSAGLFPVALRALDTRFYIVQKAQYLQYFGEAHLDVDDQNGRFLEHCFARVAVEHGLRGFVPRRDVVVNGVSGSTGREYEAKPGWWRWVKHLVVLGAAVVNPRTRSYVSRTGRRSRSSGQSQTGPE